MAEEPLNIEIRFDTTAAEQTLGRLEERARKGLTFPVRAADQGTAAQGSTPAPAQQSPAAQQVVQQEIDAALARGDVGAARSIAAQAGAAGIPASLATPTPAPRQPRVMRISPAEVGLGGVGGRPGYVSRNNFFGPPSTTGLFFSAQFGGWEFFQAQANLRRANLAASLAGSPMESLEAMQMGIQQATTGPLGAIAGGLLNATGLPISPANIERDITREKTRLTDLDFAITSARGRMRSEASRAAYAGGSTPRIGELLRKEQDIQNVADELTERLTKEAADLKTVLDERVSGVESRTLAMGRPVTAGVQTEAPYKLTGGARTARQTRYNELVAQIEAAKTQATFERAKARTELSEYLLGERADSAGSLLSAQGRDFGAGMMNILSAFQGGKISGAAALAQVEALRVGTARQNAIATAQISGETWANRLAIQGSYLQANRARIDARYGTAFANLDPDAPGYARQKQALMDARQAEYDLANRDEGQRLTMLRGGHEASQFLLSRQPVAASARMIEAERQAALGIGTNAPVTDAAEIARINEQARDRIMEAVQGRADQIQNININQRGRQAQIAALLRRDPIGANVAGIVANARAEEARLRQAGLTQQADRAMMIGMSALQLEKQNYLDAFTGTPVSKDYAAALAMGVVRNAGENPANVLQTIEDAMKGAAQPGTTGDDVPSLLRDLIEQVKGLGSYITN